MKVKIVQCLSNFYWYKDLIDCVFKVVEDKETDYLVEVGGIDDRFNIKKCDCKIIDEETNMKLTEKQADKLYYDICDILVEDTNMQNEFKAQLKLTGWMEKSAKEEFEIYVNSLHICQEHIQKIKELNKAVIREAEEK